MSDIRSEYIVHFMAPYKDPRLEEVQLENHLYLVTMTQEQAERSRDSLKRMFDAGFVVHGYEVALAELVRVRVMDLGQRIAHLKQEGSGYGELPSS